VLLCSVEKGFFGIAVGGFSSNKNRGSLSNENGGFSSKENGGFSSKENGGFLIQNRDNRGASL
jgi:hypothetical protein